MSDRTFPHSDSPKTDSELRLKDELDGTYSLSGRARLEAWSAADGNWIKVAVNSAGAIATTGSSGGVSGGTVDQGAAGASPWLVSDTANGTLVGSLTETAPATDTASSGLNGRLQRVAQRLTSLIALLPGSLGQKTSAGSLAVVIASDQSTVPISGTVSLNATTVTATIDSTQVSALAQDATLGPVAARPSAYTLNDRLYQIAQKLDKGQTVMATEATLQRLLAATAPPKPKPYTTLLHRG